MKNFKKSQKLENVKYAIRGRLMEEANKLEQNGNSILKLNIGNPAVFNFSAPNSILESMKNNLEHSQGYSDSKGLKIAREAIIKYYKGKNVNDLALDEIFIGNGVSELILMSMQALLNPDDEILGAGATIHKLISKGHNVAVAIMVSQAAARKDLSSTLSVDEAEALSIIGVKKTYHADFPNIKMNTIAHLDLDSL